MSPAPRRIIDTEARSRPLATWLAGLALAMLVVGGYGAMQPLLPPMANTSKAERDDKIEIMDFQEGAQAPSAEQPDQPEPLVEEIEIPPVPDVTPPLTPPEVAELQPLETPPPAPVPQVKPKEPKPAPKPKAPATSAASTGTGTGSAPTLFSGAGTGRFSSPAYPQSARSSKQQGTVRLLVTVEASGLPSSVEVQTSSGFATLDNAASDHLRRRWRWPAGPVRRYIVPIRFVLQ